ncbi:hypothetical protein PC122_g12998 [Phytophthora cactorum]|nr:hypothetical protein PC122_g12998 [Phytophthora cactorum]
MTSPPLAKTRQRLQILIAGALALVLWLCKLQTIACQSLATTRCRPRRLQPGPCHLRDTVRVDKAKSPSFSHWQRVGKVSIGMYCKVGSVWISGSLFSDAKPPPPPPPSGA